MKLKKLISIVLAAVLTAAVPQTAGFAETVSGASAEVTVIAQSYGAFLAAPQSTAVDGSLSDTYGMTDSVENGVSALDALIKAHELVFGEDFTPDTAAEFLSVNSYGYVTKNFGEETFSNGFFLNGGCPNDGTESGNGGYNGTTVATQKIQDGDKLDFFVYQDTASYLDNYTWIDGTLYAAPGESAEVTVSGYSAMYAYMYQTPPALKSAAKPLEGVSLAWVDENGGTAEIENLYTDKDGKAVISIPEDKAEGTYFLTAFGTDDTETPVIMNPTAFLVSTEPPAPPVVSVTGVELPEALSLFEGESRAVECKVIPDNATDKTVTWSSSDETVAAVSDGTVTAIHEGSAIITAVTTDGGHSASCTVTVAATPTAVDVMHNIAAKYASEGIASDGNAPWFAADLAGYAKAFPESENKLSDEELQNCLNVLIEKADTAVAAEDSKAAPSDLAKYIIAFRALGYDPTNIMTSDFRTVNIPQRLAELVEANNAKVKNVYTLPYVIIAAQQGDYLSDAQMNALLASAKEQKASWQNTRWGVDAATPMMLALAPYRSTDSEIDEMLRETETLVRAYQTENGATGNAASTGLTIAAFSALGIDAESVKSGDSSLIDGLMANVTESFDGFKPTNNSFGTEQGFRGLVAWQLSRLDSPRRVFDFADNPQNSAQADWTADGCPVKFDVIPEDAEIAVEGQTALPNGEYDLPEGEYSYTIQKSGYVGKTGTLTISAEDAEKHVKKTVKVSLASKPSSDSRGITVSIKVLNHSADSCDGKYTYKNNAGAYRTVAEGKLTMSSGQTVFDALHTLLGDKGISYTEKTKGYISQIGDDGEFDHGKNSGWMFMVNGKVSKVGCRAVELVKNSTVVWFYTDDYENEYGSESWSGHGGSKNSSTESKETDSKDETKEENKEEAENGNTKKPMPRDVNEGAWYEKPIRFVLDKGIMNGVSETEFAPEEKLSRAMLVTILHRLESEPETAAAKFTDVADGEWYSKAAAWAADKGIINGVTDTEFAPELDITREQLAAMLFRYAKLKGIAEDKKADMQAFRDADMISDYAADAFGWAVACGIFSGTENAELNPQGAATRAEGAAVIMRFFENADK